MTFDAQAATEAYLNSLGAEALARSAAYTHGNHWLLLWGLTVSAVVTWMIVRWGILDRVASKRSPRGANSAAFVVGIVYFLVSALLGAPFFVGVYALIRRTGRRWWIWSGGLTATALAAFFLAAPVVIGPIFNEFEPVPAGAVRDALAEMAQRAGVPTDRIFVYDGSRQSNNFTANVAGLGSSARIAISDVAFQGASLDEVKAVTGHEIGHYVLHHDWRIVIVMAGLAMLCFFLVDRLFPRFALAFGSAASLSEPQGLPVLLFMIVLFALLAQPVTNALSRVAEIESDRYSLETVNLPDALAAALLKTAVYRNPRPHPLEEMLFYTHPSVERRVRNAMEWKAAHIP